MKYYSTNKQAPVASLQEAVVKGLAADKGLLSNLFHRTFTIRLIVYPFRKLLIA